MENIRNVAIVMLIMVAIGILLIQLANMTFDKNAEQTKYESTVETATDEDGWVDVIIDGE